ncbi:MAG TPA: 50S ribosomal protein L6 [Planctomycetota bacterium]|nr:50S ribosomal protein L6 [Planctomycetota bacterium]
MSRIGKLPVAIPKGVAVEKKGAREVRVKGPKGELSISLRPEVEISVDSDVINVSRADDTRDARAYHGMTRALLSNMMIGVTQGYQKTLEIVGVGWNATVGAGKVTLNVGFCKQVIIDLPSSVNAAAPNPTTINLWGADKQLVGQVAAKIRSSRPPEPYKGKGVRYKGEYVRLKAGKSFGS